MMVQYSRYWKRMPDFQPGPGAVTPLTKLSVIIPARNEALHIQSCLKSILEGHFPHQLLEIWVVDDHSADATAAVVHSCMSTLQGGHCIHLLSLADAPDPEKLGSPKKKAIEWAMKHASGQWMVCTDADCTAPPGWLYTLESCIQAYPKARVLVAPVVFHQEKNDFERFQSLDFLGMMGITAAGIYSGWHHMGNGANLAFDINIPGDTGAYKDAFASGDDMFLIQKTAEMYPGAVVFVKSRQAVSKTTAMPDWPSFFQQRLRWGSKNAALPEWQMKIALGIALLFCTCIVLSVLTTVIAGALLNVQEGPSLLGWSLLLLAIKALADIYLLRPVCRYFGRMDLLSLFWPAFIWHLFYIVLLGWWSIFKPVYIWKSRTLR